MSIRIRLFVAGIVAVVALFASAEAVTSIAGRDDDAAQAVDVALRYEVAVRTRDWTDVAASLAPEFTLNNTDFGSTQDASGFLAWARLIAGSYPDFVVSFGGVRSSGAIVVVH